jgi:hypothetical protein
MKRLEYNWKGKRFQVITLLTVDTIASIAVYYFYNGLT